MGRVCDDARLEVLGQLEKALKALSRSDYKEFDLSIERAKKIGDAMRAGQCQALGTTVEFGTSGIKHVREKKPL